MLGIPQALSRVRPTRFFRPLLSQLDNRRHKVLQLQSAFSLPEVLSPLVRFSGNTTSQSRSIASSSPSPPSPSLSTERMNSETNPEIKQILSFWFDDPETSKKWFGGGDSFDEEIRTRFGELVTQARADKLDHWTESPQGSLALILLLDQFPRNIYRSSEQAHASDAKACQVAVSSIAREFDQHVANLHALFFYLPLMHDETVVSQIACIALSEALVARCQLREDHFARDYVSRSIMHAKGHRDTIVKFGRFPKRNDILGRESTEEEKRFLEEHPAGFFYDGPR